MSTPSSIARSAENTKVTDGPGKQAGRTTAPRRPRCTPATGDVSTTVDNLDPISLYAFRVNYETATAKVFLGQGRLRLAGIHSSPTEQLPGADRHVPVLRTPPRKTPQLHHLRRRLDRHGDRGNHTADRMGSPHQRSFQHVAERHQGMGNSFRASYDHGLRRLNNQYLHSGR